MIVSASRRTDIPAFYAAWFMNRVRAGSCLVPNPFNANQISRIPLTPELVQAIVFWTRDPRPLLPFLPELDRLGHRSYFLFTLLANPRALDPGSPSPAVALAAFRALSEALGPERVIWRYDPIVLSAATPPGFHIETFARLAQELRGLCRRAVISFMVPYRKAAKRLAALAEHGLSPIAPSQAALVELVPALAKSAREHDILLTSCAEEHDLLPFGVAPGKCVDDELLSRVFGIKVPAVKDPHQRAACRCVPSRDIGMYDSCLFGCRYCYATASFARARLAHASHDPQGESLLPPAAGAAGPPAAGAPPRTPPGARSYILPFL